MLAKSQEMFNEFSQNKSFREQIKNDLDKKGDEYFGFRKFCKSFDSPIKMSDYIESNPKGVVPSSYIECKMSENGGIVYYDRKNRFNTTLVDPTFFWMFLGRSNNKFLCSAYEKDGKKETFCLVNNSPTFHADPTRIAKKLNKLFETQKNVPLSEYQNELGSMYPIYKLDIA